VWRPPGLRRLRRLRLNRHWRAFFWCLCGCAAVGAVIVWIAPSLAGLFLLGIYSIPSNSIVPVPHEPGILYFAQFYHPFWIALVGSIGGALVCFADYAIVEAAMRHPRMAGAREARLFQWAVRWMTRWPFAIIWLFALIPVLPVYVVRVLAPASGYPIWRYVLAQTLGRFPRFFALAWLGATVKVPGWALLLLFVVLMVTLYLSSRSSGTAGLDDEPEEEGGEELLIPDLTDPEHPKPGMSATAIPRAT